MLSKAQIIQQKREVRAKKWADSLKSSISEQECSTYEIKKHVKRLDPEVEPEQEPEPEQEVDSGYTTEEVQHFLEIVEKVKGDRAFIYLDELNDSNKKFGKYCNWCGEFHL